MKFKKKMLLASTLALSIFTASHAKADEAADQAVAPAAEEVQSDIANEGAASTYVVQAGESFASIAESTGVDINVFAKVQQVSGFDLAFQGTAVTVQRDGEGNLLSMTIEASADSEQAGQYVSVDFTTNQVTINDATVVSLDEIQVPTSSEDAAPAELPAESSAPVESAAPANSEYFSEQQEDVIGAPYATSEAPVVSEAPVASEAPAADANAVVSEAPVTSETSVASEVPASEASQAPVVESEAPVVTSEAPATSEAPVAVSETAVSEAPAASEAAPVVSEAPATSEAPVSEAPVASEAPVEAAAAPAAQSVELANVSDSVNNYANYVANTYGVTDLGGYRPGDTDGVGTGHGDGLALDIMVPVGSQLGDTIAADATSNMAANNINYVIYEQQFYAPTQNIYGPANTWNPMPDRGSVTQNHYDHVHISFNS